MGNDSWGVFLKIFLKKFFLSFLEAMTAFYNQIPLDEKKSVKQKNLLPIYLTERRECLLSY